jgi:hypothetical protein
LPPVDRLSHALEFEAAALEREHHGVRSIFGAELRDDAVHVRFHRRFRNVEDLGDLAIRVAARKLL